MIKKLILPAVMSWSSLCGQVGFQTGFYEQLTASEPRKWVLRTRMRELSPS